MTTTDLLPGIRARLDEAAALIKDAHRLAALLESGKAVSDYMQVRHDLAVYLGDLEAA